MYVRFGGTIINLEAISYIKVDGEKSEFYSVNGALILTVPTESKEETLKVVENAMSYTNLIQAIDRLRDSFDGLSDDVIDVMEKIEDITDTLGEQRLSYAKAMTKTVDRWADLLGEEKMRELHKSDQKE